MHPNDAQAIFNAGRKSMARMIKPKSVDHFIETREKWQKEITRLREILLSLDLDETIKWMFPCYLHGGKNIVGLGGFKSYFGIWFFEGSSLKDRDKVLVNAQEGKTKELRQWRMTSAKEIRVRPIKAYIKEAIEISQQPKTPKPRKKNSSTVAVPPELHGALKADKKAATAFGKLSVSRQRGYAEYVSEAKRAETKVKRLAQIMPLIRKGQPISDLWC